MTIDILKYEAEIEIEKRHLYILCSQDIIKYGIERYLCDVNYHVQKILKNHKIIRDYKKELLSLKE